MAASLIRAGFGGSKNQQDARAWLPTLEFLYPLQPMGAQ